MYRKASWILLPLLLAAACSEHGDELPWASGAHAGADVADGGPTVVPVQRPPLSPGIFPCSRCHVGGPDTPDTRPAMPHRAHLDRDLECADCHMPNDEAEPAIPEVAVCLDCHEDPASEPAGVRTYFEAVGDGEGGYRFPRRWQAEDLLFRHAKHLEAGLDCTDCHGEASNGPFAKPKPVVLMQRCIACHAMGDVPRECTTCHEKNVRPPHENIVLHHAEEQRGCLDCHNPDDRDTVRLANGTTLPFEQTYLLCGQCHGPKLRDWRHGLHGRRTGMWDGVKEYRLCVHCHDPHRPAFPPMRPEARPARPEEVR